MGFKQNASTLSSAQKSARQPSCDIFSHVQRIVRLVLLLDQTKSMGVPLCRGKVHLLLVYTSPVWIAVMVNACRSPLALVSVIVTVTCALFNFIASALLHNIRWSAKLRSVVANVDYVSIFFMISGSCSPVPFLLFPPKTAGVALCFKWLPTLLCAVVIFKGAYESHARAKKRVIIYVILGLTTGLVFYSCTQYLYPTERQYLLFMGVFYICGSVFYGMKAPNVWPGVVGYHELFHICCLAAAACTLRLNLSVLARAPAVGS